MKTKTPIASSALARRAAALCEHHDRHGGRLVLVGSRSATRRLLAASPMLARRASALVAA